MNIKLHNYFLVINYTWNRKSFEVDEESIIFYFKLFNLILIELKIIENLCKITIKILKKLNNFLLLVFAICIFCSRNIVYLYIELIQLSIKNIIF